MDGIINIYKEKGYTSHDVVAVVRKIINQKKVGHTGTLDPEAEGVLPICIGKATKAADYVANNQKRYTATATFGITTTTQDHTGEILDQKPVHFCEQDIFKVVKSFEGLYMQMPPMYSALKVQGKKLYELARQGKTVERNPRPITIYELQITKFLPPNRIEIDVVCSKGTYIRTLCADIGDKLGYGAHMSSLVRTQVGAFTLQQSITLEQLKSYIEQEKSKEILHPIDQVFILYPKVVVRKQATVALRNGNKIDIEKIFNGSRDLQEDMIVRTYEEQGDFIGIHKVFIEDNKLYLKPVKLFI